MELFEELQWRGLVNDVTSPDLENEINNGELTFYIGTDPTADSLHIGHYSSLLMAKRLQKHGHHPIMLVGGATGFIGDPKATGERSMLTPEVLQHNYDALHKQISELFGFQMVNNLDWTKDLSVIDFLRDYGKFFNVTYMLNKETVRKRLESGISYTEFSYMILQSLDFLHLLEEYNCQMQIGGQDQWGNITSGLELIRKKKGADVKAYGLTMPLITKADGTKFGKSESGTVWLDPEKTSPYDLYQFLFNTEDEKVVEYLKKLTFLSPAEIDELEKAKENAAHERRAQKALAAEVVRPGYRSGNHRSAVSRKTAGADTGPETPGGGADGKDRSKEGSPFGRCSGADRDRQIQAGSQGMDQRQFHCHQRCQGDRSHAHRF